MKSGIYALASLDGSPLSETDLTVLGLTDSVASVQSSTFRARVVNEQPDPNAVDVVHTEDKYQLLLGYLDEQEDARNLIESGAGLSPAAIVANTLGRFGNQSARKLIGDWSFVQWCVNNRELTLLTSLRIRDQLYWASNGKHVAVAPDLLLLTHLGWVGRRIDPAGLAFAVSDFRLRRHQTRETMWRGIFRVSAGWAMRLRLEGESETRVGDEPEIAAWRGNYDDALDELTSLMRRIVGQHMRRAAHSGFLLSGGLDSSLLTVLGAMERTYSAQMFCMTSVAKAGSGVPDEWLLSKAVADAQQVPVFPVSPPDGMNCYRPSEALFQFNGQITLGPRHYLYETLTKQARLRDASLIFDGAGGEFTLSALRQNDSRSSLLRRIYRTSKQMFKKNRKTPSFQDVFAVRLAPGFMTSLPQELREKASMPWDPTSRRRTDNLRGIEPSVWKSAQGSTLQTNQMRFIQPYLDYRLLRFAAALPDIFFVDEESDRKLTRAMLRGRVPDQVMNRETGLPFAPEFHQKIQKEAHTAKTRIPLFQDSGLAEFFDLDWLSLALDRLSAGEDPYRTGLYQAQFTSMAAEFLQWLALRAL